MTLNFNENYKIKDTQDTKIEPTEEALEIYCRSIGIPKMKADLLSEFVHKTYLNLSNKTFSNQELEDTILGTLSYYKSFEANRFGTNNGKDLKRMLEEKQLAYRKMHT